MVRGERLNKIKIGFGFPVEAYFFLYTPQTLYRLLDHSRLFPIHWGTVRTFPRDKAIMA